MVGQGPVVKTLQNALRLDRVAHALLFSGVRGVGKTTLARLMAKALNCRAEERAQRPCNRCDSCREFNAGSAVDLHEIDGASNRGIDEIRELRENIRFMPVSGKYKIVIIDEVHMLTDPAFNALLKTLEEPPAHVYFMLATTELHKIPVTILSRCQRYELTRVAFAELFDFFRRVAAAEKVAMPASALEMITREADGSVRDGLSLLDQVFSFGGEQVSDDDVRQMLGLVDRRVFERLARALLAGDLARCLELFDQSYRAGIDLKRFAGDLLNYFRNLVICSATDQPERLLDLADQELAALRELAAAHSAETLLYTFNLLFKGIEEMQYATRPRLVLEMAMVRATRAGQIAPTAEIIGRLDQLLAGLPAAGEEGNFRPEPESRATMLAEPEPRLAATNPPPAEQQAAPTGPEGPPPAPAGPEAAGAGKKPPPPRSTKPERLEPVGGSSAPKAGSAPAGVRSPSSAAPIRPAASIPAPDAAPPEAAAAAAGGEPKAAPGRDLRPDWDGFVNYVRQRKVWMAPVLDMAAGAREEGGELVVRFDDLSDCKLLEEPENSRLLTEFAQDYFQQELTIRLRIRGGGTLAVDGEGVPQEERRALANDPLVQTVVELFNGDIAGIRTANK